MASASPQAHLVIQNAFNDFEQSIKVDDRREFQSTTLEQVRSAIREVEQSLAARQCLRNTKRLVPFLDGLDRYSKCLEVLCNGTPYLPWIWAPVKLMVQIASEHIAAFETLIGAYARIADTLPRFDRLAKTFHDDKNFHQVLALFYADIIDFHKAAYKFLRQSGWKCFFKSTWGRFDRRFNGILQSLTKHAELVDKEASAADIAESREWRDRQLAEIQKQEVIQREMLYQAALSWLEVKDTSQEDEQQRLHDKCHPDSCSWMTKNGKLRSWLRRGPDTPFLWVHGKPGSGKSVLASAIVDYLRQDSHTAVLFFYCTDSMASSSNCAKLLRSLAAQLLRLNPDLSSHVVDDFKSRGLPATIPQLRQLIPSLLATIPSVRVIVDGLDEFSPSDQKQILSELLLLVSSSATSGICKVLLASRELPHISRIVARRTKLSLAEEQEALRGAIQSFVHEKVVKVKNSLEDLDMAPETMARIESQLVEKADGMFLWVQLVISTLENAFSVKDLEKAVESLPKDLFEVYDRIIKDLQDQSSSEGRELIDRTLNWIAFAQRPVKGHEMLCALALHTGNRELNDQTKLSRQVLELCKPLVENGSGGTLIFVHFSVKEYLFQRLATPLVEPSAAHVTITFACILNLAASIMLVHPDFDEKDRYIAVSKGFLGLLAYADDYLHSHIEHIESAEQDIRPSNLELLLVEFKRLLVTHNDVQSRLRGNAQAKAGSFKEPEIQSAHTMFKLLDSDPELHRFYQRLFHFREGSGRSKAQSGAESEASDLLHDPTLFSLIRQRYNHIVQTIARTNSNDLLSPEDVKRFQDLHGSLVLFCRFKGCPRSSDGFSDETEREQHESLHKTLQYCSFITCRYSTIGFKTLKSLRKHVKTFHEQKETRTIPTEVPRRRLSSPVDSRNEFQNSLPAPLKAKMPIPNELRLNCIEENRITRDSMRSSSFLTSRLEPRDIESAMHSLLSEFPLSGAAYEKWRGAIDAENFGHNKMQPAESLRLKRTKSRLEASIPVEGIGLSDLVNLFKLTLENRNPMRARVFFFKACMELRYNENSGKIYSPMKLAQRDKSFDTDAPNGPGHQAAHNGSTIRQYVSDFEYRGGSRLITNRKLTCGTEVFYGDVPGEGRGLLCRVTEVIDTNEECKYIITDCNPRNRTPSQFETTLNKCIPIPSRNEGLGSIEQGSLIYALFPNTSTFYPAEVLVPEKNGYLEVKFDGGIADSWHRMSVERRHVVYADDVRDAEASRKPFFSLLARIKSTKRTDNTDDADRIHDEQHNDSEVLERLFSVDAKRKAPDNYDTQSTEPKPEAKTFTTVAGDDFLPSLEEGEDGIPLKRRKIFDAKTDPSTPQNFEMDFDYEAGAADIGIDEN